MDVIVWMPDWQMQCCGEPFAVDSEVTWTVREPEGRSSVLDELDAPPVTYVEEHHEGWVGTVHGTVASIRSVRCRMAFTDPKDPRALWPVPGTAVAVDITRA